MAFLQIAIILLIEFNNGSNPIRSNPIRKQADTYLSELVNQFPHLLWSKNVLYGMLDAVHEVKKTQFILAKISSRIAWRNAKLTNVKISFL